MTLRNRYIFFALPSLLVMAVTILYPLGYSLWVSFYSYYLPKPPAQFVGLGNYASIISDPDFLRSLWITSLITVGAVLVQLTAGFALAVLLNTIYRFRKVLTTLLFIPQMITPVVAGLIIKWMFIPDWGMVNYFLSLVGIRGPDWLNNPYYAVWAVIIVDTWQFTSLAMVVFLAGLQAMPEEPLEAAVVDGVSALKMLWHIVLPMLRPLVLFVLIIRTMDTFRLFDSVFVLTGGGPGTATETITIYNYRISFHLFQIGKGAAVGTWTLVFLMGAILVYLSVLYEKEH
jgi:multiple sugar transport system permease protein